MRDSRPNMLRMLKLKTTTNVDHTAFSRARLLMSNAA